jgi:hypothetical protein
MLSTSHNRAYQDFITLLTEFKNFLLNSATQVEQDQIKQQFQSLQSCFNQNIAGLNSQNLESELIPRWLSVQTEIKREFKLLTDVTQLNEISIVSVISWERNIKSLSPDVRNISY